MDRNTLKWAVEEMHAWRRDADISIPVDADRFQKAVAAIAETGVEEGLVVFCVLGCEWLLRLKKITDREVGVAIQQMRQNLELRLGLEPSLAYFVAEALRTGLGTLLKREGRMLAALGSHVPGEPPILGTLWSSEPRDPSAALKRLVRSKRGPIPWPAPWVAGVLSERLIKKTGSEPRSLSVDLVRALLGNYRLLDPRDYRRQRQRIEGNEIARLTEYLGRRYLWHMRDFPDIPWGELLKGRLELLKPFPFFSPDTVLVASIFSVYSGNVRSKTCPATRGSRETSQ